MSKNKFLKRLLALGIATVSAASVFGLAACDPDTGNNGGDDNNDPKPTQLAKPTSLNADATTKKLTWTGDSHASSYKVFEKVSTATAYTEHSATSCEYDLSGLAAGTYSLYVKAIGDGTTYSDSADSDKVEYTAPDSTPVVTDITIHFDTGVDGLTIADQTIKNNNTEKVSKPDEALLVWEGHVFVGWYESKAADAKLFNFDENVIRRGETELTLYAKWRLATPYDTLSVSPNKIIAEDFTTTTSIEKGGFSGNAGIYWNYNNKSGASDTANTVKVENGQAVFVDTSSAATELYIDFGHVKGVVEAYVEVVLTVAGNGWTPFQLYGSTMDKTNAEIIGIRFDGGKMKYRLTTDNNNLQAANDVAWADGVTYGLYVKADLTTGKVTIKVNDVAIADEVAVGAIDLQGLKLTSSDSNQAAGARSFSSVDYIAVAGAKAEVADYAAVKANVLKTLYTNDTLTDEVLSNLSSGILGDGGLLATHVGNIEAATSYADADSAYVAAVTAIEEQKLVNAKANACSMIGNYRSDESFETNAEAWEKAQNDAITAINAAEDIASVKTALSNGKAELDKIENDTQADKATITVEIEAVLEGVNKGKIGELSMKSGDTVTVAELTAACNLTSYNVVGFYEDAECTATPITESYTKTADSATTVKVYAKVTEKDDFTPAGTYTYTVSNDDDQVVSASENAPDGLFAWSADKGGNKGEFKFGGNEVITITLKLKVGQTVALTLNDCYTGSSGNPAAALITAGSGLTYVNNTLSAESAKLTGTNAATFEVSSDNKTKVTATLNYTVNAAGEVTITIVRTGISTDNSKKTFRLTSLSLVVADAAE